MAHQVNDQFSMTNEELINMAAAVIHPKELKEGLVGDVGCALVSVSGKCYTGVCTGVHSNVICAERVAISKMISDDQDYVIEKIVATWKDGEGNVYVIPPCGNCRQYMKEADPKNLEAEVVLDREKTVKLAELLPYHDWWKQQ